MKKIFPASPDGDAEFFEYVRQGNYFYDKKVHYDLFRTHITESQSDIEVEGQHPGIEILWTNKHPVTVRMRGLEKTIGVDEVFIYNGIESHVDVCGKGIHRDYAVVIEPTSIRTLLEEIDGHEILFDEFAFKFDPALKGKVETLFSLHWQRGSRIEAECFSLDLLTSILEKYRHSHTQKLQIEKSLGAYPSTTNKIKKIFAEIYYDGELSLDELSRQVGISKFHLIRTFRAQTGLTPMDFLNQLRATRARSLLQSGKAQTVVEAALSVGFNSASAFYRALRKV